MSRPVTCETCGHRQGSFSHGDCALSGYRMEVERRYPTVCGKDFQGWIPREPLLRRIAFAIWKRPANPATSG